jgi:hypothetical protein
LTRLAALSGSARSSAERTLSRRPLALPLRLPRRRSELLRLGSFPLKCLPLLLLGAALGTGCVEHAQSEGFTATTAPAVATTQPTVYDPQVLADVCPPAGWRLDPPKVTPQHVHKTWISPTGDTAYGVIRFQLPFPVPDEGALWGFMRSMRASEGEATLLEKKADPALPGIRFVAEGGLYKVRVNLTTSGATGWAVYAGSLRARKENPAELEQAIASREATRFPRN